MTKELCIGVAVGIQSEATGEAMYFDLGEEFTGFGGEYTNSDLVKARAALLDLADALQTAIMQKAH